MNRRLPPLLAAAAALAIAAPAAAQLPNPNPTPTPTPKPKRAKFNVWLATGIVDRKKRFVMTGDRVLVKGNLTPYVKNQKVRIDLYRGKKHVASHLVKVRKGKHGHGKFRTRFKVWRADGFHVVARHAATPAQKKAESGWKKFHAINHDMSGERDTRLLQIGLRRLAYGTHVSGHFTSRTGRAVLAFRKVNGMSRNTYPSSTVFWKTFHGEGAFHLRHKHPGTHVEVDLSRQVIVLTKHGRPWLINTVSTGKPSTPTIKGSFSFYRKDPGYNSEQMYYSSYFHGGYAVHGYPSVPATYPASHGCVRLPIPDAKRIYHAIHIGEKIWVYQ